MGSFIGKDEQIKILSIDFDVFCDMSTFRQGACSMGYPDWVSAYPEWLGEWKREFKFNIDEFNQCKNFLSKYNGKVVIGDDHRVIFNYLDKDLVHITNLDFHSDLDLCKDEEKLDCGNWISALKHLKACEVCVDWRQIHTKDTNGSLKNLQNPDMSIEYSHKIGFDSVFDQMYDMVFLVQSYEYSPPHMNHRFRELIGVCKDKEIAEDSPPFFPTYSERVEYCRQFDKVFIFGESGKYTYEIADDVMIAKIDPDLATLDWLQECDPEYKK